MIPTRIHSNGVPWLIWAGEGGWACEGCGASGRQPPFTSVASFARWAGDTKRAHAAYRAGAPLACVGGVGHPLNPDRAER